VNAPDAARQINSPSRAAACLIARMGHNKGKDNVKKRAARRRKAERLAATKSAKK
jgi:GH24 family phage-related lysozyme (muramidase)